ncbi:uncharacterized protein [Nicotiana tomentosiformis]|uniref:uncharacterized protein n=1 Tax=Nicotiana tomentosiformis TaxID=4098 RepID=UPI00388C5C27
MADALGRKSMGSLRHVEEQKLEMTKDLYQLANLGVRLLNIEDGGATVLNTAEFSLVAKVKAQQFDDPAMVKIRGSIPFQKKQVFELSENGVRRYEDRLCVPNVKGLREHIMVEIHQSWYFIHSVSTKMYQDL